MSNLLPALSQDVGKSKQVLTKSFERQRKRSSNVEQPLGAQPIA